ncbi:MAG: GntR family transcriptional regulator [Victivallaceae bacterium]|nr:GntR family transcriptional regulator [Victivallaceae bacterium]
MIRNRSIKKLNAYSKLEEDLRKSILQGTLSCSKPISTEAELAKNYNISRSSTRIALQRLVNEGMLRKVHGRGTFIVPPEERSPELVKLLKILVIMPGKPDNIYDHKFIAGVADYAYTHQCDFEVRYGDLSLSQLQSQYKNLKYDGIIWERPNANLNAIIEGLRDDGIPQITISRQILGVPSIAFDYNAGIKEVVKFFHGIGHSEIIFFDLDNPAPIFKSRQDVFVNELRKIGLAEPERYIYKAKFKSLTNGQIKNMFDEHPDMSALVFSAALSDEMVRFFESTAMKIPEALSVLMFCENNKFTTSNKHPYSILVEPRHLIGVKAAESIKLQKSGGKINDEQMLISGELVIRKSCSAPARLLETARA